MAETFIDPSSCPLCGKSNECAMEREKRTGLAQGPCWCTQVRFDADLIAKLPQAAKNAACICATCANAPVAGKI